MHIDRTTLAQVRIALHKAVSSYLFDPERKINLIDFGQRERDGRKMEDQVAIRFHVDEKIPPFQLEAMGRPEIPPTLDGFQTDVLVGAYRPQQWAWWWNSWQSHQPTNYRARRADPLRGGLSISDEYHNAYGTLGGLVEDRDEGYMMILSNWHVLAAEWWARPGQRIYQPGRRDGGLHQDAVATLERDAMAVNLDAAVARLNGQRHCINEQVELGSVSGVGWAELGMEVMKSGRGSGRTYGAVTGIEGIVRIGYSGVSRLIRHVVTIEPLNGEVSRPGDSGSWWLDRATNWVVGLHFAGGNSPERGLAMDIQPVLDALNVNVVTRSATREVTRSREAFLWRT